MDHVVVAEKQIPYRVFQIDLSQEHTDVPLGMGKLANNPTILDAPSYFTYKFNSPDNDPIPAEKGQSYNVIVFSEIYVSNIAASGMAKIHTAWNTTLKNTVAVGVIILSVNNEYKILYG